MGILYDFISEYSWQKAPNGNKNKTINVQNFILYRFDLPNDILCRKRTSLILI